MVLGRHSAVHFCSIKFCIEQNRCHCLWIAQPLNTALSNFARAVMATLKKFFNKRSYKVGYEILLILQEE